MLFDNRWTADSEHGRVDLLQRRLTPKVGLVCLHIADIMGKKMIKFSEILRDFTSRDFLLS